MKAKLITTILLVTYSLLNGFSQNSTWLLSHVERTNNKGKSYGLHNRLLLKITENSVSLFDAGKEDWNGDFETTYNYVQSDSLILVSSNKGQINGRYRNDTTFCMEINNESYVFYKIQDAKNKKIKKTIDSFLSENVFVANLSWGQPDTLVFNTTIKELSGVENLSYQIIFMDGQVLLMVGFEGQKIYPIIQYSKTSLDIQKFDKEMDIVSFKVVDKERKDYKPKVEQPIQFE